MVLSQIRDDHSYINIQGLKDNALHYAGFLCTYENGQAIVVHSIHPRIEVGDVVVRVNGKPVSKYIEYFTKIATPETENPEVNYRRACAFLSVFNPFMPVRDI